MKITCILFFRCAIEILREKNIAENRAKMLELGLLEKEKPK